MAISIDRLTDINSAFHEGRTPSELVWGVDAIANQLQNLFTTSSRVGDDFLGDRPYEPTYGCGIERHLFDPLDEMTAEEMKDDIYDAVTTFIPEIFVTRESIVVIPDYDNNAFKVFVYYVYEGNPYDWSTILNRTTT